MILPYAASAYISPTLPVGVIIKLFDFIIQKRNGF